MTNQRLLFKFFLALFIPCVSFANKNAGPIEVKIQRFEKSSSKVIDFLITAKALTPAESLKITARSLDKNLNIQKFNGVFKGPIQQNATKKVTVKATPLKPGKHTLIIDVTLFNKKSEQSKTFTEVFTVK